MWNQNDNLSIISDLVDKIRVMSCIKVFLEIRSVRSTADKAPAYMFTTLTASFALSDPFPCHALPLPHPFRLLAHSTPVPRTFALDEYVLRELLW